MRDVHFDGVFRKGSETPRYPPYKSSIIMKTVLNDLCIHVGFEHDGRLIHTDKKSGVQMASVYTWPSLRQAREAWADAFGKSSARK
jgi:hypothetical protein